MFVLGDRMKMLRTKIYDRLAREFAPLRQSWKYWKKAMRARAAKSDVGLDTGGNTLDITNRCQPTVESTDVVVG